jgi:uncharacterized protein
VKAVIRGLAAAVSRAPWALVIGALVLSGAFGALSTRAETSTGQEGFAPDNEETDAFNAISELFGAASTESVMQVVVRSESGDVISADALRAVTAALGRLEESDAAQFLSTQPDRPASYVSYLAPVELAVESQGIPVDALDDSAVRELYEQTLQSEEAAAQLGFVSQLVADPDEDGRPESGLLLVFVESVGGDSEAAVSEQVEREQAVANALQSADVPPGIELRPFSFSLMFGQDLGFESELGRLFATAFGIIVAILMFVYWVEPSTGWGRSLRRAAADMAVTMLTIVMAIGWMQGIGTIFQEFGWVGAFSEIAQIVPVLLIGLGVDYGIHLNSRYREEIGQGEPVAGAIRRAIGTSGVALALATVTTMIGFLTNVVNPVPALRDFGILAAVGIFASFALMLTFVPALRLVLDRRAEAAGVLPADAFRASSEDRWLPRIMEKTAVLAERFAVPSLVVMLALGGLGFYGLTQLETRFSFTDFFPADSPVVETFGILNEDFGGGFGETTQVLVEAPAGGDLATPEVYNALGEVSANLVGVEDVLVVPTPQGEFPQVTDPRTVLLQLITPTEPGGVPENLELAQAALGLGLQMDGSVSEDADVAALWDLAAEEAPEQMSQALHRADDGSVDAIQIQVATQAGEEGAGELRTAMVDALAPITGIEGVTAVPTSSQIISDVVVNALSDSQVSSLVWTILAATVVLMINFWFENRRPFLGVLTMIPVALVVLWTFGLMHVSGIPFGPVTATLAALAVGIGVPYTIHIARRFEEDRNRFPDLESAIRSTTRHTGGALAGSAFTTAAGFGILVTSSLTPFRQMGQVTAYAIVLALIGSVLVLPSLLVLWERYHRRKGDLHETPETVSAI